MNDNPRLVAGRPSEWITRWSHLVPRGASVLDVACGSGRHLAWFKAHGATVTGVDIDIRAAQTAVPDARLIQADIEQSPWPLVDADTGQPRQFDAVVVTNYLWRPLADTLLRSLAPGGVMLYETFASGNETVGRPARPDYLLRPGELLDMFQGLHIVAYENGFQNGSERFVQRIAAVKNFSPGAQRGGPARYAL